MENKQQIRGVYSLVVTIQVVALLVFVLDNLESLDSVPIELMVGTTAVTTTVNIYALVGILGMIFGLILLSSITIFGSGFSSEGTRAIAKFLGMAILWIMSAVALSYYLGVLGGVFAAIQLLFVVVYVLEVLTSYL